LPPSQWQYCHPWVTSCQSFCHQQLLEKSDETVDAIADRAGFGNATALRHHFRAWRGTTPNAYRRMFRGDHAGPVLTAR
jgi:AraC-like DNA-binding protein